MSEARDLLAAITPQPELPVVRDLGGMVLRAAAELAWSARNPREPFVERPDPAPPDRVYYRAADGWESPLWRYPPKPGASGEPLVLAHGLGMNHHSLDFRAGCSLARAAWREGYDVYLLAHRGDRHAVPPPRAQGFDFDDIVDLDLPAALARVLELSGASRALWIGHALGGQLLYGHLARGGADQLAAGIAMCAAVTFPAPASTARVAALAARLLPASWQLPTRALHRAMAPLGGPTAWAQLCDDVEGPALRGLMVDGVDDLHTGLLRQVARWVSTGHLCDRDDRFDYVAGLRGVRCPTLVVAAAGDNVCPPSAARPAADALGLDDSGWLELGADWGHLDPVLGRRAPDEVYDRLLAWLETHRRRCWTARG